MYRFVLTGLAALTFSSLAAAEEEVRCRTVDTLRIDHASQMAQLGNVCEVGILSIFADDNLTQVTLPNLRHADSISVEATNLEALSLPALETAGQVYVQGGRIKIVELPSLRSIDRTFYAKAPRLETINLMNLGTVGSFYLSNVPALTFIFLENIYDINVLDVRGAAALDPAVRARLDLAAGIADDDDQAARDLAADIAELERQIHELQRLLVLDQARQPSMPPTGHPVQFGTIGTYYNYYPYYFYNYWNVLRARGMTSPYGSSFYWWWHN